MANLLIVDDDSDVSNALSEILQGAGHFVRTAATGEDGLRVLRAAQLPDCILLDVDMPVLTGPDMAHRMLRHDAGEEFVPVVLLSGRADLGAIAARIGTPYFLAKPPDSQVLLDLIDRAVREHTAPTFVGMKEEVAAVEAAPHALPTAERGVTDNSLREERKKTDNTRRLRHAAVEKEADDVVRLARTRADAALESARDAKAQVPNLPITAAAERAETLQEQAADRATSVERLAADTALDGERAGKRRILEEILEAERTLTDTSLEDERIHADVNVTSRDDFLGMVIHDLRGMLAGVALNVSVIARTASLGESGAATRKSTATIQRIIGRMNRLIGDLLDVASIEAGTLRADRAPADARQVALDAVEAFAEIAASKRITLRLAEWPSAEPMSAGVGSTVEPLTAWFDYGRVLQVLANLLSNALKFTATGGSVLVRVARVGAFIQFTVEDNGLGIPAEMLTAIFDRFRQVNANRLGLGLGLYISKNIVEAHAGRIWAESQLGGGSTIHFAIPAAQLSGTVQEDVQDSAERASPSRRP